MERVLFAPRALPPLGPDVSQDADAYNTWVHRHEAQRVRESSKADRPPREMLHLVLPAVEAPSAALRLTLEGLGRQTINHWLLTLICSADRTSEIAGVVRRVVPRRHRRRIHLAAAVSMSLASQVRMGIAAQHKSALALVFPGDIWTADAVDLLSRSLSPDSVVYADDDDLTSEGTYASPRLKPDFSPDFLLSTSYIGVPLAAGSNVVDRLPEVVGSNCREVERDLALAACSQATSVTHVPEVLCHRTRAQVEDMASRGGEIIRAALDGNVGECDVSPGRVNGTYRVRRPHASPPLVSVIVPFRDEPRLLRTCVDSVTATTTSDRVQWVLIDNGSTDPEILTLLEHLDARDDVTTLTDPRPFNWATLNNSGAEAADGDVLLFLNNDIEALTDGWLTALTEHAVRDDVAAVGARLLYPDGRLQHCGVVVGLIGAAGHPLIGLDQYSGGYLNMALAARECSAVTGACLASRRAVFTELRGFDETLGVDLNDVDYCLRGGAAGYRTLYEPAAELLHHESPSRGTAGGAGDIMKFIDRWGDYIAEGDPFLNAHITRSDVSCALLGPDEKNRWNQWYSSLTMT